jgi:hypothetical protein
MPDPKDASPQPLWMKILIALLFGAGLVHLVYMFTGAYAPYGNFYPAAMALLTVMGFAGLSGVVSAEKWGVWVFGVAALLVPVASFLAGAFGIGHLLLLLPAGLFFSRLKGMK